MSTYGEDVRPWPERGYFLPYEHVLASIVYDASGIYVTVGQTEAGAWAWAVGAFSWTPDGDLWHPYFEGLNATEAIATREGSRCADRFATAARRRS